LTQPSADHRGIGALAFLTVVWGSSFSMIALALRDFSPVQIVIGRMLLGGIVLLILVGLTRQSIRGLFKHWRWLLMISAVNYTVPFVLVSVAQQTVTSAMTAVFMSAIPLFTLLMSRLILKEVVSTRRWLGFALGLAGLLWLTGADLSHASAQAGSPWPQLGLLLACLLFALSAIVIRRMPRMPSLPATAIMLLLGAVLLMPIQVIQATPMPLAPAESSVFALLVLAVFSTALGQFMRTFTIQRYGPIFFSVVGYLVPVWATVLGVWLLNEQIRTDQLVAFGIIMAGLFLAHDGGFETPEAPSKSA